MEMSIFSLIFDFSLKPFIASLVISDEKNNPVEVVQTFSTNEIKDA